MKRRFFLSMLLWPSLAQAHSSKLGNIAIGHSWALPATTLEAPVMMPLVNNGGTSDSLVSASSPIAKSVELRNAAQVETEFVLEPHKPFPMRALARHLHLMGLNQTLIHGQTFPLTLKFKTSGEIEIQVYVADKPGE